MMCQRAIRTRARAHTHTHGFSRTQDDSERGDARGGINTVRGSGATEKLE